MTRAPTLPRPALRTGALLATLACVPACRGAGGGGSTRVAVPSPPVPRFACVANEGDHTVSVFTVDAATGALTHAGSAAAGSAPVGITTTGTVR